VEKTLALKSKGERPEEWGGGAGRRNEFKGEGKFLKKQKQRTGGKKNCRKAHRGSGDDHGGGRRRTEQVNIDKGKKPKIINSEGKVRGCLFLKTSLRRSRSSPKKGRRFTEAGRADSLWEGQR